MCYVFNINPKNVKIYLIVSTTCVNINKLFYNKDIIEYLLWIN